MKNGTYTALGRRFHTLVFVGVDTVNSFLEDNSGYGVIGEIGDNIHVAALSDRGERITPPAPKPPKAHRRERAPVRPTPSADQLERDLAAVEKKLARLNRGDAYLNELSRHFHLGRVGGSGKNNGRLNRRRERSLERTIKNASIAVKLQGRRDYLRATLEKVRARQDAQKDD